MDSPSLNDVQAMPSLNELLRRFALMKLQQQQQQEQQQRQPAPPPGGPPQDSGGPQVGNVFGMGGIPDLNQLLSHGLLGGLFGGQQQSAPAGGQDGGGPQVGNVFGVGGIPSLTQLLSHGVLGGLFGGKK